MNEIAILLIVGFGLQLFLNIIFMRWLCSIDKRDLLYRHVLNDMIKSRRHGEVSCPHGHYDWDDCPDCRH